MPEPIPGYDLWKMADRTCSYGKPPDDDDDDGDRADEPERTMPVGPFLDSLNHDAGCGCEWCRFNDGDRADEAHDEEGDR